MQEIELKFQIPADSLEALTASIRALPGGQAPAQKLQAAYFDTPDRKLARARAALRVRQEDEDWVQTLKAAGANAMTRIEDNQPVPPHAPGEPIHPDLSRHQSEQVRQALVRDLGWQPEIDPRGQHTGLIQLYRTDMLRLRAHVDVGAGGGLPVGRVEMALDLGIITAGHLSAPVRELEIELLAGHPQAVLDGARDLVLRHGLWLDAQTKAHRGDQLAREAACGQASPQRPARPRTRIKPDQSAAARWLSALDTALDQVNSNLSEVALHDAPTQDLSPWIKGWSCGLRRLRWTWRHAPADLLQGEPSATQSGAISDGLDNLLTLLRPRPGVYLYGEAANRLARSTTPTLLALAILAFIVGASQA